MWSENILVRVKQDAITNLEKNHNMQCPTSMRSSSPYLTLIYTNEKKIVTMKVEVNIMPIAY